MILSNKAGNFSAKLNTSFQRPFIIIKKILPTISKLKNEDDKSLGKWNTNDSKKYIQN